MSDQPPPARLERARPSIWTRVSIIWLIPLAALIIALSLAWQTYADRGPLIEIAFENGAHIKPRETELRFRDIPVGLVERIRFADDLSAVIVSVRVDKEVAPFIDAAATFWVVEPELTTRGVSGLDTVLSGVYIEGAWDDEAGAAQSQFRGLSNPPLFRSDRAGLQIALRTTPGGSLTDNSPITFRGIEVGRVGRAQISREGNFAIAEAIIFDPHTNLISERTRFWDTSGFSFSVGPNGAEIDFSSLATLVSGGLTFDTFVSGGGPVIDGTVFFIYPDESTARSSLFSDTALETLEMRVVFDSNIAGLRVDAPVELNGLKIGAVESVSGVVDDELFGDNRVRLSVLLAIQPGRLGLQGDTSPDAARDFLTKRVSEGLRARLASTSLLTRGLKIELVQVDNAPPATLTSPGGGAPIIPTTQSDITDASASVKGVFTRINDLPIEELLTSAIDFLNAAEAFISDEDLRETPQDLRALLTEISGIIRSNDVQSIPAALNATLTRIETLLGELEEQELARRLVAAVDATAQASADVSSSVEGFPALMAELQAVAEKANSLPLDELATQLTALVSSTDAILGSEAAKALPADLSAALQEINATLGELRAGGAVTNVNATLKSTREAADALVASTDALPGLVTRAQRVLGQASATLAGYNQGDVLSRDARAALRDISQAAEALESLARMLERNPSALVRGR